MSLYHPHYTFDPKSGFITAGVFAEFGVLDDRNGPDRIDAMYRHNDLLYNANWSIHYRVPNQHRAVPSPFKRNRARA